MRGVEAGGAEGGAGVAGAIGNIGSVGSIDEGTIQAGCIAEVVTSEVVPRRAAGAEGAVSTITTASGTCITGSSRRTILS